MEECWLPKPYDLPDSVAFGSHQDADSKFRETDNMVTGKGHRRVVTGHQSALPESGHGSRQLLTNEPRLCPMTGGYADEKYTSGQPRWEPRIDRGYGAQRIRAGRYRRVSGQETAPIQRPPSRLLKNTTWRISLPSY